MNDRIDLGSFTLPSVTDLLADTSESDVPGPRPGDFFLITPQGHPVREDLIIATGLDFSRAQYVDLDWRPVLESLYNVGTAPWQRVTHQVFERLWERLYPHARGGVYWREQVAYSPTEMQAAKWRARQILPRFYYDVRVVVDGERSDIRLPINPIHASDSGDEDLEFHRLKPLLNTAC